MENTQTKSHGTIKLQFNRSSESFSFNNPFGFTQNWMTGVTSLEGYNTSYKKSRGEQKLAFQMDDPFNKRVVDSCSKI